MKQALQNQAGFKLVELLILVAIIGIILSIAIPQFQDYQRRSQPQPTASQPQQRRPGQDPIPPPSPTRSWPPLRAGDAAPLDDNMLRRNYYLVLDGSGSMKDRGCSGSVSKFDSAVAALANFITTIPAEANVGLAIFDKKGFSERVPLGTGNRPQLLQTLQGSRPEGGTPLRAAIKQGYLSLTAQAAQQLGYGEYHLVIVTDGEASQGFDPTREVNNIIDGTAILIHTIGYCIGEGHSLNQPGRTHYSSVDNAGSLSRELQSVLAEAESFDLSQFQ